MHTHQLATAVWRWRRDRAPLEPLLRRVATKNLVLVSSGGSDWIAGSGKAERVEGGWKITARKIFASGVPIGDVIVTSAIWDDPRAGQTVLHFPLSLKNPSVTVLDTWRVLGMRGSGSHDILIEGAFIPEADVLLKVIWQIAPGCSGPQDPKDAVQNTAVIHAGHAARACSAALA
jgi:acyl-CoA dehydrogenase